MNLQYLISKTLYRETPGIIIPEGSENLPQENIGNLQSQPGDINDIYQTGQLPKIKIWFVTEKITATSQITSNPTVDGRIQNDNIILDPLGFQFRFKVTDVLGRFGVQDAINAISGAFPEVSGFFSTAGAGVSNSVFQYMLALRALRRPFSIVTSFGRVRDVAFESLDFDRDVKTANSLPGNMTLKELFIVSQEILGTEGVSDPVEASADTSSGIQKQGIQQAVDAS